MACPVRGLPQLPLTGGLWTNKVKPSSVPMSWQCILHPERVTERLLILNGYYRIPNMRVGGPYTVSISYTGFEDVVKRNVYLTLGQTFQLNSGMSEAYTELESVTVTASKTDVFDGNRTGQTTMIGKELIDEVPSVSRAIADFARLNPLATVREGSDGFNLSLAGQNNRYNTIYIDGAVNNDVFGLSESGTNGGQTGAQPFPIDAFEQFQVAVAPFDVRQSGFAGGSINAVTRSGTNDFEGSAYYFFRNEQTTGKTPTIDDALPRERLEPFDARLGGFRIGGPIVKNKAFFFLSAEVRRDEIPQPFDVSNYLGASSPQDLENFRTAVLENYGYGSGQLRQ